MAVTFLTLDEVLALHAEQIELYGGQGGLRDQDLLSSALAMPEASFEGEYLHPSIPEMAAAYLFHVCKNHPFLDGNKRAALASCLAFLWLNDLEVIADVDALAELVEGVAEGSVGKAEVAVHLAEHSLGSPAEGPAHGELVHQLMNDSEMALHHRTPLWRSRPLTAALGAPVLLKMEALQPVGSFKIRGIGAASRASVEGGAERLVGSSGGNAGLALAYAGRELGVAVTVYVPRTTPEAMRERIRAEGAEVVEHGDSWDDAHARALEAAAGSAASSKSKAAYIHPFDDERLWSAHATMIEEAAEQGPRPAVVVLSVGGGGLLCGVLEGMHRVGWDDVPVVAVETEGAASFAASVEAGELVTLEAITSLATTLGARTVTAEALRWTERHPIVPWTVTDREAVAACVRFATDHRILVEPACGAALAPVYQRAEPLAERAPVLVVVCGGAGADPAALARWRDAVGGPSTVPGDSGEQRAAAWE